MIPAKRAMPGAAECPLSASAAASATLNGAARNIVPVVLGLPAMMSTVGAAQRRVTRSDAMDSNTVRGSTRRRQMCVPPHAVIAQTKPHPLAWNMGSVHR